MWDLIFSGVFERHAAGLQPLSEYLSDREQLRQSGLLKVVDPDTAIGMLRDFSRRSALAMGRSRR